MKKIFAILCALVLVVSAMSVMAFAAEGDIVLFEGSKLFESTWGWDDMPLPLDGASTIVEGSYLTVTYTGAKPNAVCATLEAPSLYVETDSNGHLVQIDSTDNCATNDDGSFTSTFTYAQFEAANAEKNIDYSKIEMLRIRGNNDGAGITVTNVTWHAPASTEPTTPEATTPEATTPEATTPEATTPPVKEDVVSKLFSGSHEITSHWNWEGMPLKVSDIGFDASVIAAGGYFRVTYTGTAPDAIYLVVVDDDRWVDGKENHFVQLDNAESCTKNADGSYTAIFSFSQLAGANTEKKLDFSAIDFVRIGWNNNGEGSIVVSDVSWVTPGGSSQTGDSSVIVIASVAVLASVIGMVAIVSKRRFAA